MSAYNPQDKGNNFAFQATERQSCEGNGDEFALGDSK